MRWTGQHPELSRSVVGRIGRLTAVAMAISVLITAVVMYAADAVGAMGLALSIATICPLLVTPPAVYLFHRRAVELETAHRELCEAHRQLFDMHAQLQASHRELEHKARHDPMTGLANRGAFLERLSSMRRATDQGYLLMIDADNFKRINDSYGHDAGDRVLSEVARAISESLRADDFGARIGGEEFAIILRGASREEAGAVAERVRVRIEQASTMTACGELLEVTVSIGGAAFGGSRLVDQIMRSADVMLYEAKNSGRNRVCIESRAARAA